MLNITADPGHLNCRSCQKYNQPACTQCKYCKVCCQCRPCEHCRVSHPQSGICRICGVCRSVGCSCPSRPGGINVERSLVGTQRQTSLTHRPLARVTTLDRTTRPVAIEVELSNHSPRQSELFRFRHTQTHGVRDGSIRSEGSPIEFIVGPIPGLGFEAAMEELSRWLVATDASVNESCGLHVHVDGGDLKAFEMRRVLELYHLLEGRFYRIVAPARRNAHYSRIYTEDEWERLLACRGKDKTSGQIREAILRGVYSQDEFDEGATGADEVRQAQLRSLRRRIAHKYDNARYCGLNLHSWFHRGTIEFRHMEGTVDPDRIRLWTLWCRWLVQLGAQLRDDEVREIRSVEDYLSGSWKRPGGVLALPQEVSAFARRDYIAPPPQPTVTAPNGIPVPVAVPPDDSPPSTGRERYLHDLQRSRASILDAMARTQTIGTGYTSAVPGGNTASFQGGLREVESLYNQTITFRAPPSWAAAEPTPPEDLI